MIYKLIIRYSALLLLNHKLHADTIHTVASILSSEALTDEDVTEMAFTVGTYDLGPSAICISYSFYGTFDLIIKTRPPAVTVELVSRAIKRLITLSTDIHALSLSVCILSCKWSLCSFI